MKKIILMVKIQPYNVTYLVSPLGNVQNLDKITFWYLKVLPHSTKALLPSLRKKSCSDICFWSLTLVCLTVDTSTRKAAGMLKLESTLLCILDSPWKKELTKDQKGLSNWPSERQSCVFIIGFVSCSGSATYVCRSLYILIHTSFLVTVKCKHLLG